MTGATSTISSEIFVASASSTVSSGNPEPAWQAFNYVIQTSLGNVPQDWTTNLLVYTGTGPNGLKAYTTNAYSTVVDGNTYYGEWLQLKVGFWSTTSHRYVCNARVH